MTDFSLKTILLTIVGILAFGSYLGVLIAGDNSLNALNKLKDKNRSLAEEERVLKIENQKLQKKYFVLKIVEIKEY